MKICEKKHWSIDDFKALSEDSQEYELAWFEYSQAKRLAFIELLESKVHRNKDNEIDDPQSYLMVLLARLELL